MTNKNFYSQLSRRSGEKFDHYEIVKMLDLGYNEEEISKELGIPKSYVEKLLKEDHFWAWSFWIDGFRAWKEIYRILTDEYMLFFRKGKFSYWYSKKICQWDWIRALLFI